MRWIRMCGSTLWVTRCSTRRLSGGSTRATATRSLTLTLVEPWSSLRLGGISSSSTSQRSRTGSWSHSATCLRSSSLHSSPLRTRRNCRRPCSRAARSRYTAPCSFSRLAFHCQYHPRIRSQATFHQYQQPRLYSTPTRRHWILHYPRSRLSRHLPSLHLYFNLMRRTCRGEKHLFLQFPRFRTLPRSAIICQNIATSAKFCCCRASHAIFVVNHKFAYRKFWKCTRTLPLPAGFVFPSRCSLPYLA
ncbi:hypothetical protein K438DRAFT_683474 [Mycena galopus ATCC 62051]|nr:hypothetical protein K438DRAFT_683474 [Mycena galopus ATCC 62051]